MKNKNGITLVALIITIIVMVILAGVAISSVVREGGVIEKTETATVKMEEAEILEKVQTSTKFNLEGNIDLEKTFNNIKTNLKAENVTLIEPANESELAIATEVKIKVKGNKGEYLYTINTKKIDNYKGITLDKTEINLLMLGSNSTESLVATLIGINDTIEWSVNDETIAKISAENNIATITALKSGETTITARSGEYSAKCNIIINTLELGQEVYYDGDLDTKKEKWYVYNIDESNIEIISANTMYYPDGTRS